MIKSLFIIVMLLLSLPSISQDNERKLIRISGTVIDLQRRPVSYAHILVPARNTGVVGDYYGQFELGAYPGDTLLISAVSFHKKRFVIPFDTGSSKMFFLLEPDTILLSEQVIYPWPETYEEFSKEFIALETVDPMKGVELHLPTPQELKTLANSTGGITMPGPFSLLYDRFSKEARTKKTMNSLQIGDRAKARYNPSVISRITGLTDQEEIQKLVDYCDLAEKFILDSTEYELYAAIIQCYEEFSKAEKEW